jgi:homocysteine S-methyltransferase
MFANHPKVFAIGVNCTAPKYVSGIIDLLKSGSGVKRIIVYPNSGEAYNAESKTWLGLSDPELFVEMAKEWIQMGADIIGGCCRIGPDHIGRISDFLIKG